VPIYTFCCTLWWQRYRRTDGRHAGSTSASCYIHDALKIAIWDTQHIDGHSHTVPGCRLWIKTPLTRRRQLMTTAGRRDVIAVVQYPISHVAVGDVIAVTWPGRGDDVIVESSETAVELNERQIAFIIYNSKTRPTAWPWPFDLRVNACPAMPCSACLLSLVLAAHVVFTAPSSCACLSVTLRYCIKMAKCSITQIMPHDSPGTLVTLSDAKDHGEIRKGLPYTGTTNAGGVG